MARRTPGLGTIHEQILDLLKAAPDGMNVFEIREALGDVGVQQHLDKRVRELRNYHRIPRRKVKEKWVYFYEGQLAEPLSDTGFINRTLRAEVLHRAHGKCQMCGRSVQEDGVKLEIDHQIPRTWGGLTISENLWALCQPCNGGKRDYFASFNDDEMRRILAKRSVYERIAETLRLHLGEPTPSWLLEFVANAEDFQEDWHKRLRELRYPAIGLKIRATRAKANTGKWESAYQLDEWKDLPPDHKFLIKEHERVTRASRR